MRAVIVLFLSFMCVANAFSLNKPMATSSNRISALEMKSNNNNNKWSALVVAAGLSIGSFGAATPANAEGVFFERKTYSEVTCIAGRIA
jgi:hypothetical protein